MPAIESSRRRAPLRRLRERHAGKLVVLALDVTDRAAVFAAVEQAVAAFGRLDVVVNNAGYGLAGTVEEVGEAQARALIETNFFGALWVCQAVIPHLRAQRSGHIVQLSSVSGLMGIPTMGIYSASKFALEGVSEALMQELAPFGVHVTLVEPQAYATDFMGPSMQVAAWNEAYLPVRAALMERYGSLAPGDPRKVAAAVVALSRNPNPPHRLLLGDSEYDTIIADYRRRIDEWAAWEAVSRAAG
jgi:NAD(P)-dependent dehydrogenase (short-subunit alcohol dehydrogenase family)